MACSVYVFVDNSNVWIEGKKVAGRSMNPPVPSNYNYRIEYGRLLNHVLEGRPMGAEPQLYGSEPPQNDSVWQMIRSKGFDVQVFRRNIFNKEKGVDMKMGIDITKLILGVSEPGTIVIVAGDADFLPVIEEVQAKGWLAEIWYWSCAAEVLKGQANRFVDLDSALAVIGFETR